MHGQRRPAGHDAVRQDTRCRARAREAWLDRILANRMPKKLGRIALCHMLVDRMAACARSSRSYERRRAGSISSSAGALERHDQDYSVKLLPATARSTSARSRRQYGVLVLAGPRSREVLQKLTDTDLSNERLPVAFRASTISVGAAHARALRVNFVGELGWELHHPIEMQNYIFDLLMEAGSRVRHQALRHQGDVVVVDRKVLPPGAARTVDRICGLRIWASTVSCTPTRASSSAATRWWRGGRRGFQNWFVTMEVMASPTLMREARSRSYSKGKLVGRATNGGFGWRVGKSLALGMVRPDLGEIGTELEVVLLGKPHRAAVIPESPYDPGNARLRG